MRRKKLVELANDSCVCLHPRKKHKEAEHFYRTKKYIHKWCSVSYCGCPGYLDRRHLKIKVTDPILQVFLRTPKSAAKWGFDYFELVERSGMSLASCSRKMALFELLGLVERGYAMLGWRDGANFKFINTMFNDLIKEGIIIDE